MAQYGFLGLGIMGGPMAANPMFAGKGALIAKEDFAPAFPLKHMQKDLRLATALGDILGLADEDYCAVYKTITDRGTPRLPDHVSARRKR